MLRSLSLFSGCLGLDLGMEMSGIRTVAYVDKDPVCRRTIAHNRPNVPVFDDVFSMTMRSFAKKAKVDVVVGGPPCQSFSTIGRRRFLEDPRGQAVLGFVEVIEFLQPSFFVMENVQGIISAKHGGVVDQLQTRFSKAGYNTKWDLLNAVDFGVPQSRKRFLMIGYRGRHSIIMPSPIHGVNTLYEAIGDLEDLDRDTLAFPASIAKVMPKIPEGGCWKSLPPEERARVMGNATLSSGGLTAFYRRLSYSKPSPTLLTSPVQRATTLCHPKKNRPLSVAEYKRIQCFPDDWKVAGSLRDQYRQLGNAVPVLFGKAIGKALVKMAKGLE